MSTATYTTGDAGADFGNTYYNDHHFHFGYFVNAAALVGHMQPSWIPKNKDYINMLARDYANPSSKDPFFPPHRNFDPYHGHSWAHGLFESTDGKVSSSYSAHERYLVTNRRRTKSQARKTPWRRTASRCGARCRATRTWPPGRYNPYFSDDKADQPTNARGDLMLSIMSRALKHYYLYCKDNAVQPANFIGNKVAGILFENKVDHVTFFGDRIEYIQGIHMLPLQACTLLMRDRRFVEEEWKTFFSDGRADKVDGGWRGILYGNLAAYDPKTAYKFFANPKFDLAHLDGGASRTWYMCYAAGEFAAVPPPFSGCRFRGRS